MRVETRVHILNDGPHDREALIRDRCSGPACSAVKRAGLSSLALAFAARSRASCACDSSPASGRFSAPDTAASSSVQLSAVAKSLALRAISPSASRAAGHPSGCECRLIAELEPLSNLPHRFG